MKKPKSLPKLKKEALSLYSELVKLRAFRDGKMFCYTCDRPLELHSSNTQLGHFLSRGCYPGLTFHSNNSRLQDYHCNIGLKGNTIEFRERLIAEIGLPAVESLEAQRHNPVKLGRSDYVEMMRLFNEEIKTLKDE